MHPQLASVALARKFGIQQKTENLASKFLAVYYTRKYMRARTYTCTHMQVNALQARDSDLQRSRTPLAVCAMARGQSHFAVILMK